VLVIALGIATRSETQEVQVYSIRPKLSLIITQYGGLWAAIRSATVFVIYLDLAPFMIVFIGRDMVRGGISRCHSGARYRPKILPSQKRYSKRALTQLVVLLPAGKLKYVSTRASNGTRTSSINKACIKSSLRSEEAIECPPFQSCLQPPLQPTILFKVE
jgi:hypothetical protein